MFHPLAEDTSKLKDAELEAKINELTQKFFRATNPSLQRELSVYLEIYQAELQNRRAKIWQEQYQKRDKDLDNLINVN